MYLVIVAKGGEIFCNKKIKSIADINFSEQNIEGFTVSPNTVLAEMYVEGIASHYPLFSKESCEAVENLHTVICEIGAKDDCTLLYKEKPFLTNLYKNLNSSSYSGTTDDGYFVYIIDTCLWDEDEDD